MHLLPPRTTLGILKPLQTTCWGVCPPSSAPHVPHFRWIDLRVGPFSGPDRLGENGTLAPARCGRLVGHPLAGPGRLVDVHSKETDLKEEGPGPGSVVTEAN